MFLYANNVLPFILVPLHAVSFFEVAIPRCLSNQALVIFVNGHCFKDAFGASHAGFLRWYTPHHFSLG